MPSSRYKVSYFGDHLLITVYPLLHFCLFLLQLNNTGPKPRRVSKVSDLWSHPRKDSNHPYSVNYLGMKRILAAMKINNINRLIRITGALTTKNAFSPFVFLFNLLGSFRVKWNELSEIDIRRSGVDYTGAIWLPVVYIHTYIHTSKLKSAKFIFTLS